MVGGFAFPKPDKFVDWALALAGVVAVGAGGVVAIRHHLFPRAQRLFRSSLLSAAKPPLRDALPYVNRSLNPLSSPFTTLSKEVIILKGPQRTGKSVNLAHAIAKEWFPWWLRWLRPPRGFYLVGNQSSKTAKEWLKAKLTITTGEDPFEALMTCVVERAAEQRIRDLFADVFGSRLPHLLRPQPSIIIIDRAEELIAEYRGEFLSEIAALVQYSSNSPSSLQLIFVVYTKEGADSLLALNGGSQFCVYDAPLPSPDDIKAVFPKDVDLFLQLGSRIGLLDKYKRFGAPLQLSPEAYAEQVQSSYDERRTVQKPVTKDEILRKTGRKVESSP